MMIRGSALMLFIGGFMLWMMSQFIPILRLMAMDWVGWFMAIGAIIILMFIFGVSQVGLQYDTIPAGSAIINYIRRDGIIAPLLGKRVFPGESFLDVPRLGIIEDLGKDTVLLWGRKKIRFGIENINYTPDPRYFNLCKELYELGIDDSDELSLIMNIPEMNYNTPETRKLKSLYLIRMAEVYWNMKHRETRGGKKLVEMFKKKKPVNTVFGKKRHTPDDNTNRVESVYKEA
jgi:hypothetical protein